MGSFSWLRADTLTRYGNIYEGGTFKCLIPKEFGGGYIKDIYMDYGRIGSKEDGSPKYDMLELLAIWNADCLTPYTKKIIKEQLKGVDFSKPLKEIDENTEYNRGLTIGLSIESLKYPLKLVSVGYKGTYEECEGISLEDPEQGCKRTRAYYEKYYQIKDNVVVAKK